MFFHFELYLLTKLWLIFTFYTFIEISYKRSGVAAAASAPTTAGPVTGVCTRTGVSMTLCPSARPTSSSVSLWVHVSMATTVHLATTVNLATTHYSGIYLEFE